MKKLTLRLSEKTHEDLIRLADGRPLQTYLERMIDQAIIMATDPPRAQGQPQTPPAAPRPARDVATTEPVPPRGSPSPSLRRFET